MINVGNIISSPAFAQPFTIKRSTGQFARGGYTSTPSAVETMGVVRPTSAEEIDMLPEGDRVSGLMSFWSRIPINGTSATGTSDILSYLGEDYRVRQVYPSEPYGFTKAIASRLGAE